MIARPNTIQRGFALPALIFFLTAATILIAAAVPVYQMQAKRAQEEELIFRGEEYMRAIQKFQRKFNAWPPSLDALVQTNGIRFIRKPYTDPMTGKPFRVISINPDGSVNGSTLFNPTANNRGPFGQQSQAQQNLGMAQTQQAQNFSQALQPNQAAQRNQPNQPQTKAGAVPQTVNVQNNSGARPGQPGVANPQTAGAAGIIGVASENESESIKVYNGRQKYNEWEFIALVQQTQQNQQNPQNPQNPQNQQNPFNPQNQQNNGQRSGQPPIMPGFGPSAIPQPGFNQPGFNQPGQNQPRSPFGFGPQPQQPQQPQPQPNRRPN